MLGVKLFWGGPGEKGGEGGVTEQWEIMSTGWEQHKWEWVWHFPKGNVDAGKTEGTCCNCCPQQGLERVSIPINMNMNYDFECMYINNAQWLHFSYFCGCNLKPCSKSNKKNKMHTLKQLDWWMELKAKTCCLIRLPLYKVQKPPQNSTANC